MEIIIRTATRDDLPAFTEIYNHFVRSSHATFDTDEFTVNSRTRWFEEHADSGPHLLLVAAAAGEVVGYATSSSFRTKPAYRGSVETTVYVSPKAVGHRIGRMLYAELFDRLEREPGLHRAYAGVALPNVASVDLHLGCGFTVVGTFSEAGYKGGRYVDVQWFERELGT